MPEVLNFFTLSRSLLSILSVSTDPSSTLLHLSESLDTLLCDRIVLIPGRTLLRNNSYASGGVAFFVRLGLSFSELSPSSLGP